ncbi:MAG: o-succinylbenzoate--CoA ligase [Candidatus Omnitrophica bacterium]|nr:o-succinylbenzoate--CoA ligase [Candidatus Omnitrophota bacterium]
MRNISCPLYVNSQTFPQQAALLWGRRSITWHQLNLYVQSTARYLREIGVSSGTRVAVRSVNSVEYVVTLLALWRVGACVMPLSLHLPAKVLDQVLAAFRPAFTFSAEEWPEKVAGAKAYTLSMLVSFAFTDGFFGRESHLAPSVDLDADVGVVLTSGSSGVPKGVLLSYGNFFANAAGANAFIPFAPPDRWLLSMPLCHVSGLAIIFRALQAGGAVTLPDAGETLEAALERYRPTHISLVPVQLKRILSSGRVPGTLKAALLGGGPVPRRLAGEGVQAGWPLYATYGMTESASLIATGPVGPDGYVDVRVLPGRELCISAEGEVLVRGEVLSRGYLFGSAGESVDREGWFHTGDCGVLDQEGRLRILGRQDNMFISGGENVHPETVEKALLEHPDIAQALVLPVSVETFGQRPVAFVRCSGASAPDVDAIAAFLRQRLAHHEMPVRYYAWPKEQTGEMVKIGRRDLMELMARKEAVPCLTERSDV